MSLAKALQNPTLRPMGRATVERMGAQDYKIWQAGKCIGRARKDGRLTWLMFDEDGVQLDSQASTLKSAVGHFLATV